MPLHAYAPQGVILALATDEGLSKVDESQRDKFVEVPDGTVELSVLQDDGTWLPPSGPAAGTTLVVDVPTFFMRFTPQEEAEIRASADPVVVVFVRRIDDPRTLRVNLGLPAVQQGVGYLEQQGLIEAGRAAQILAPQPLG